MISEIFYMDGYGIYVWGSFAFTFLSFMSLYLVIKNQELPLLDYKELIERFYPTLQLFNF